MSKGTASNPLTQLAAYGQAPWVDFICRDFIASGALHKLVEEDGITGVTSNPAMFEKAVGTGADYEADIRRLLLKDDLTAGDLYERLAIEDIRGACEVLKPVFETTDGRDGYVSFEVAPNLANNQYRTVADARRLWKRVDRPNLMIKIPATEAGIAATRDVIARGINVNVTLLFSVDAYKQVLDAYMSGLEAHVAAGHSIAHIASVASFFVSRIDMAVDAEIDRRVKAGAPDAAALEALRGKVAIASAQLAYQYLQEVLASPRWKALAAKGAQPQRLLWASTGPKDKKYPATMYADALIGPHTVDTLPPATLEAFRAHGKASATLPGNVEEAKKIVSEANRLGLDLPKVCETLLTDGIAAFNQAFDALLGAVETRRVAVLGNRLLALSLSLPEQIAAGVSAAEKTWSREDLVRRIWERDPSVWTGTTEAEWLGWLTAPRDGLAHIDDYEALAKDVKARGFKDILLLGMGGSSLGPEVLAVTFGQKPGWPALHVVDTTDPRQIADAAKKVDLAKTLFIVSSKSGSTLEPNILFAYFWEAASKALGKPAGEHFVAVTDPRSMMEKTAKEHSFGHIFYGNPQIGGRYSVLSPFGMVPAAAAGYDVRALLENALLMVSSCDGSVPPAVNPGVELGLSLGVGATTDGRDKVTFVAGKGLSALGAWLEQLIAESTGKEGTGLIPIDGEDLGNADVYGSDRVFVDLRLGTETPNTHLKALRDAGNPVVDLHLHDALQIGQAFFVFEFATAVAGAVLGIDPFNQPDVEFSKVETRKLTTAYAETGHLPPEKAFASDGDLDFYADPKNAEALLKADGGKHDAVSILKALLGRVGPGDYIGLLAYIDRNPAHIAWEQEVRLALRDALHVATAAQFGPRFLHSTGQAYKGGPDSGVFLQVTADDANDLTIPGHAYKFGVVEAAQARGDFDVLAARGRRALRVHIKGPLDAGLEKLKKAIITAVKGA